MKKNKLKTKIMALFVSAITLITAFPLGTMVAYAAESYDGGWAIAYNDQEVFNETSCSTHKGTIYRNEGVTVLNVIGDVAKIQYSTSGDPKTGYVPLSSIYTGFLADTCVAKVTTFANTYYGNSTSYGRCGSVTAGELVVVLAKNDNWVYVEYNTTSGRKRGYMLYSNLSCYNRPSYFPDLYTYNKSQEDVGSQRYSSGCKVYSGPSTQYTTTDTLDETIELPVYYSFCWPLLGPIEWEYVEYTVNGVRKSGFIESDYY